MALDINTYTIFGFDSDPIKVFKPVATMTATSAREAVSKWVANGQRRRPEQVVAALNPCS